jgi:hypothetical protein
LSPVTSTGGCSQTLIPRRVANQRWAGRTDRRLRSTPARKRQVSERHVLCLTKQADAADRRRL